MLNVATLSDDAFPSQAHADRFSAQLKQIYRYIKHQHPFVSCIELALHEPDSSSLQLHVSSCSSTIGDQVKPCRTINAACYQTEVIHDINAWVAGNPGIISEDMDTTGLQTGLCLPITINDQLNGFALFGSSDAQAFTTESIEQMRIYTRVITELIISKKNQNKSTLSTAVNSLLQLNHVDRAESPEHLQRVAHYSRFIAEQIASQYALTEEWIDHLFLFAPLHDIGKAFLPESLLNKPGRFTPEEYEQVKDHTIKGRNIVDHMIRTFGYTKENHFTEILRNIVTHHHETIDGQGYPYGLKDKDIPLEAKIVAVADVLDALLAKRVYKEAWSLDDTISELRKMAGSKLEAEIVEIVVAHPDKIMQIRQNISATEKY